MRKSPGSTRKRVTLVESLAQDVLAFIQRERLNPGDRLPTVRELADELGVAVPTMRGAIRNLEAFGVVEVQHGSGVYVRSTQPRVMVANPGMGTVDGRVVLDLIDTRLLLEPYCAAQAAKNPDQPGIARLARILEEAEDRIGVDDRALMTANIAFHNGIAECAGNVVLHQVLQSLSELHLSEQAAMLWLGNARKEDHREHTDILAAIQSGNSDLAADLMRNHLSGARTLMAIRLAEFAHARKLRWLDSTNAADFGEAQSPPSDVAASGS